MGGLPLNVPSHRQGSVLMMMPFVGDEVPQRYAYRYDHEQTAPYRYSVYLDDFGIVVDYAPAERSAIFGCTFEKAGKRHIQLRSSGEIFAADNALWGWDNYNGTKH
jgi:hypothetical protein